MMFAIKRKHKVNGRTLILISSIKHKNTHKYQGVLEGKNLLNLFSLESKGIILLIHQENDIHKLKINIVVKGNL